jgi:ADP-ribose pyrophosphatase YjhB (NUDIX family)
LGNTIWKPNVVVAAVVERDGRFLLVEERAEGQLVLNQPAGHLEDGESLVDAVVRETLEETAWHFEPQALLGVYRWPHPKKHVTYLRFAFIGTATRHDAARKLDDGIERALWLTHEEIIAERSRHRSPLLERCVDDYLTGRRYPLALLQDFGAAVHDIPARAVAKP